MAKPLNDNHPTSMILLALKKEVSNLWV